MGAGKRGAAVGANKAKRIEYAKEILQKVGREAGAGDREAGAGGREEGKGAGEWRMGIASEVMGVRCGKLCSLFIS